MPGSAHPGVGTLLLVWAAAGVAPGCSAPQAGGQTGDENTLIECTEVSRTPIAPDDQGPGGFSAADSTSRLLLQHETTIELLAGEPSDDVGSLEATGATRVALELDSNGWRVEAYDRSSSARAEDTCESKLATDSRLTLTVNGETALRVESGFALDSPSYGRFRGVFSTGSTSGALSNAVRVESGDDELTLVGGVTALGSWGRLSLVDGTGLEPDRILLAWPRIALCENGGVAVGSAEAQDLLADPELLAVEASTSTGGLVQQEWRLQFDVDSVCVVVADEHGDADTLVATATLGVLDIETGLESQLAAVVRSPVGLGAAPVFELTVIGSCASIGSLNPETFAKSCGDWRIDASAYDRAHIELVAILSTDRVLDGQVKIFGETKADCVDGGTTQPDDEDDPSAGSCTGTESFLIGELHLAAMLSQ